jgi:hypothetical protein
VTCAVSEPDAEQIAAAVLTCPSVAGLHSGRFGEVATYLPGRRVGGVRITPEAVSVHVVVLYPATIAQVDSAVRAAVAPHVAGLPVVVAVEDLTTELPKDPDADEPDQPPPHNNREIV